MTLLEKLQSDLAIKQAEFDARSVFSMNHSMHLECQVLLRVIKEIQIQIQIAKIQDKL